MKSPFYSLRFRGPLPPTPNMCSGGFVHQERHSRRLVCVSTIFADLEGSNMLKVVQWMHNSFPHGTLWQQQWDRELKKAQQVETRFKTRQLQHAPSPDWARSPNCVQFFKSLDSAPSVGSAHSPEASNLGSRTNEAIAALNRVAMSGTYVNTSCANRENKQNTSRRERNNNMDH